MLVIRRLVWDAWNIDHIARHGVTRKEVNEACHGDYSIRESYGRRLIMISPTKNDRLPAIVLAFKEESVYYPVTAWYASVKLRRIYEQEHIKGETL
jgi:uncharacterized protein